MANAAPTGCYKCGRPGHWSRDCPSSAPSNSPNPIYATGDNPGNLNNAGTASSSKQPYAFKTSGANPNASHPKPALEKPKRAPRTRPKLTPELLLSNDGLGYVLRHFPREFNFRGHGHEVSDLGKLIGLYSEWHSRLLPYFSFDQFVRKIEQLGTTRRVKMTIRELRERVANGGDLTKLHESAVENDDMTHTQETMDTVEPSHHQEHHSTNNNDTSDMHEDILHEVYEKAVEEPSNSFPSGVAAADDGSSKEQPEKSNSLQSVVVTTADDVISKEQSDRGADKTASAFQMTEEQRTRMEERRLKALEKAAARKRLAPAT